MVTIVIMPFCVPTGYFWHHFFLQLVMYGDFWIGCEPCVESCILFILFHTLFLPLLPLSFSSSHSLPFAPFRIFPEVPVISGHPTSVSEGSICWTLPHLVLSYYMKLFSDHPPWTKLYIHHTIQIQNMFSRVLNHPQQDSGQISEGSRPRNPSWIC